MANATINTHSVTYIDQFQIATNCQFTMLKFHFEISYTEFGNENIKLGCITEISSILLVKTSWQESF